MRSIGHSHGLVDDSIKRSRAGLRAVFVSLGVLGLTALVQIAIYMATSSVALLADLIHNLGDALTAIPLAIAFYLRSARGERWAGYSVVFVILVSACVAMYETIERFINPREPQYLWALAGRRSRRLISETKSRLGFASELAIASTLPRSSPTATMPESTPTCPRCHR